MHCHVDAGPARTEAMDADTVRLVLRFLEEHQIEWLDVTGGAPELNPLFRDLVRQARGAGVGVIDRCNLTILSEPGQADLADFLAAAGVRVVASLPCHSAANVDRQRGKGVFERSLAGIRQLNARGYGLPGSGLELDFVFNPQGPVLPPATAALEEDYKRELGELGIVFNRLLTITNMPINRFRHALERNGVYADYMDLLVGNFADDNLAQVMCRTLLSVDWQGYVYDCDFNQMLDLPAGGRRRHLRDVLYENLEGDTITTAPHCFGCTAGQGSSCGGALQAGA